MSDQTDTGLPKHDWRDWKGHMADMEKIAGAALFQDTSGRDVFIVGLCQYVWENAAGDGLFKHRCLEQALTEAGFVLNRSYCRDSLARGSFGQIAICGVGVVLRSDSPYKISGNIDGFNFQVVRDAGQPGFFQSIAALFGMD
jgi:hypothetical protein